MPAAAMSDMAASQPAVPASAQAQFYREPLGPPTRVIDVTKFLSDAKNASEKAQAQIRQLEGIVERELGDAQATAEERCSLKGIHDDVSSFHGDLFLRSELDKWQYLRTLANPNGAIKIYRGRAARGESEAAETPDTPGSSASVATGDEQSEAAGEDEGGAQAFTAPRVTALIEEADKKPLRITKTYPELPYYMRKARTADYNSLTAVQYTTADTIGNGMDDGNNSPQSSLSSILYTLTIHALTRSAPVTIDGESSRPVPFPTRHQVMHVLGSTTLAEVRAACRVGGDSIPRAVESDASDEEERSSESNSEEDEDESDDARGGRRDSKRQRRESASNTKRPALGPAPPQKMPKWVDERRDTGHAFAIEGKIYADGRDTVLDYADMILKAMDATNWPSSSPSSKRKRQHSPTTSISTLPTSLPLREPQPVERPQDPREYYRKAESSTQNTRVGDLGLRVGEPYWFVHQGNCEHVWTVDSIRSMHPSDPQPTSPTSSAPYPITTFLSRAMTLSKCRVCDVSPGEIITLDDGLAGESPALLCRICFEHLHVDEDGNEDGVKTVPLIFDE